MRTRRFAFFLVLGGAVTTGAVNLQELKAFWTLDHIFGWDGAAHGAVAEYFLWKGATIRLDRIDPDLAAGPGILGIRRKVGWRKQAGHPGAVVPGSVCWRRVCIHQFLVERRRELLLTGDPRLRIHRESRAVRNFTTVPWLLGFHPQLARFAIA